MLVTLETTSIVEGLKLNQSEILKMTELKMSRSDCLFQLFTLKLQGYSSEAVYGLFN